MVTSADYEKVLCSYAVRSDAIGCERHSVPYRYMSAVGVKPNSNAQGVNRHWIEPPDRHPKGNPCFAFRTISRGAADEHVRIEGLSHGASILSTVRRALLVCDHATSIWDSGTE
jgi:hypothetical protein